MFVKSMLRARIVVCGKDVGACAMLQRNLHMIGFIADVVHLNGLSTPACCCADYAMGFLIISDENCDLTAQLTEMKKIRKCPFIVGIVPSNLSATKQMCLECGMADAMDTTVHLDALYECICSLCSEEDHVQPLISQDISGVFGETSFFDSMETIETGSKAFKTRTSSNAFDAFGHASQHEQEYALHDIWEFGTNTIYM